MQDLRFIHLTDLHLSDPARSDPHLNADTVAALEGCIEVINAMAPQPDFVVASGDLVNLGDEGSYRLLRRMMSGLRAPVLYALGNHDDRAAFRRVFAPDGAAPEAPFIHEAAFGPLDVITLDSSVKGRVGGALCEAQFAFLEAALARRPERAKLLIVHHPPRTDPEALVWESLDAADSERLGDMIEGRNVAGILSGHIHFNRIAHWRGVPAITVTGLHSTVDLLDQTDMRIEKGTGFGLCALRPSGLSVAFAPLTPARHVVKTIPAGVLKQFR
ncbi:MAG: metallophosphoesterase [Pikeienuella sp.]